MAGPDQGERSERIGRYQLLEHIAAGAQGTVWLAEQRDPFRKRVALKILNRGLTENSGRFRFDVEREALARMDHGNIARVLDSGTTDLHQPYIVMEYVPGLPLTRYCDKARLGVRARLRLMQEICSAVHHAHQKGVIHRDLKPANLLVSEQDGRPTVKVVDFGLARAAHGQLASGPGITSPGQPVGTLEYMSPEQADAETRDVDITTDIYSLGVILFELLVGELPFPSARLRGAGQLDALRIIREEPAPRPSRVLGGLGDAAEEIARARCTTVKTLAHSLSRELGWITLRCLEKDRGRRYQSANALSDDIERYLARQPVHAGPPTASYRFGKWLQRHRAAVATGTAVFLGLIAALIVILRFYRQAERSGREYQAFADPYVLAGYQREAREDLYPALPEMVQPMEEWLAKARRLLEAIPAHRLMLAELEHRQSSGSPLSDRDRLLLDNLRALVPVLERLAGDTIAGVEQRLATAKTVHARTVAAHRQLWSEIATATAKDPRFGFRVEPQVGLVPIATPDPISGLWEFVVDGTGGVPPRGADGRLQLDGETGIVLVLIPGGSYQMGAQSEDVTGDYHDPAAAAREGPVHPEVVTPFLLGKHEMTQLQWKRQTGRWPSSMSRPTWDIHWRKAGLLESDRVRFRDLLPVENVSWDECDHLFRQLGLRLPTEAEWEYAARAGIETPWPTGATADGIEKFVNVADQLAIRGEIKVASAIDREDGFPSTAPIDAFPANAYGLHNMLGNVWEWVADDYANRHGQPAVTPRTKVYRGGSWYELPVHARYSNRQQTKRTNSYMPLGVRAARDLQR